jgi:hypothetical protein
MRSHADPDPPVYEIEEPITVADPVVLAVETVTAWAAGFDPPVAAAKTSVAGEIDNTGACPDAE